MAKYLEGADQVDEIFEDVLEPKLPTKHFGLSDKGDSEHWFVNTNEPLKHFFSSFGTDLRPPGLEDLAVLELGSSGYAIERDENGDLYSPPEIEELIDSGSGRPPHQISRVNDLRGWLNANSAGVSLHPRFGPKGILLITRDPIEGNERLLERVRGQLGHEAGRFWPGTHSCFFAFLGRESDIKRLLMHQAFVTAAVVEIGPGYAGMNGSMDPLAAWLGRGRKQASVA